LRFIQIKDDVGIVEQNFEVIPRAGKIGIAIGQIYGEK
jgi:hypothetical protein